MDYLTYRWGFHNEYKTEGDLTKTFGQNKIVSYALGKVSGIPTNMISIGLTYGGLDPFVANQIVERPVGVIKYPINKAVHNWQMRGTLERRKELDDELTDEHASKRLFEKMRPTEIEYKVNQASLTAYLLGKGDIVTPI